MDSSFFNIPERFAGQPLSHGRLYAGPETPSPTILFVHGGFHGAWCWAPLMRLLTDAGLSVAAVDLRGHGGLPQNNALLDTGPDEMVADIIESARRMAGDVILAGHSIGALLAMQVANRISARGLVLMAPAAPAALLKSSMPLFPNGQLVAPPEGPRARKWFLSGSSTSNIDPYLARLCPESPKLLNACFQTGVPVDPAIWRGPTLCLSGGHDATALHPAKQDQAIAAWIGAELTTIPASGHCMMLDDGRETTARFITAWVEQLLHGARGPLNQGVP